MIQRLIYLVKGFFSNTTLETPISAPAPLPVESYPITFDQSPNFSSRRNKIAQIIVLHHTGSLLLKSAVSWFKTTQSQVSAHYVVGLDGTIIQMVKEEDKAWHAGDSVWYGKKDVNSVSIGIEIVGDGVKPFTEKQYVVVAWLCREIKNRQSIADIVGHADIAVPKGRKVDPKPFDWAKFKALLDKAA